MPAILVEDLVVSYGPTRAVDHVSLGAEAGQVVALLGPNGAGKTTTVETLEGYRRPDSGTVRVLGLDPVSDRRELVPRIGVMLQQGGLYPSLSSTQAIRLFSRLYDDSVAAAELLEAVGLTNVARTPWRSLSGGERQRLALALALIGRPRVAFLDEPTSGIDPTGRQVIRRVIRGLADQGVCVLMTTHELDEAERLADHVVIVDRGRVVTSGAPAEIMASGRGRDIRFGAPPAIDVSGLALRLGGPVFESSPGEYTAEVPASPPNVAALTAWLAEHDLPLGDLRAGRQSLEDVFLALTSNSHDPSEPAPPGGSRRQSRRRR